MSQFSRFWYGKMTRPGIEPVTSRTTCTTISYQAAQHYGNIKNEQPSIQSRVRQCRLVCFYVCCQPFFYSFNKLCKWNLAVCMYFQGMVYIHSSKLGAHGSLKSSNCLVDNRWMLKVTDYGLCRFSSQSELADDADYETYKGTYTCMFIQTQCT